MFSAQIEQYSNHWEEKNKKDKIHWASKQWQRKDKPIEYLYFNTNSNLNSMHGFIDCSYSWCVCCVCVCANVSIVDQQNGVQYQRQFEFQKYLFDRYELVRQSWSFHLENVYSEHICSFQDHSQHTHTHTLASS